MITRRSLTASAVPAMVAPAFGLGGLGLLAPSAAHAALPFPPSGAIRCRAIRKGDDIGTANYTFTRDGDRLRVDIAIELVVKLGPIAVYRYTHRNTETWDGDELVGYDAQTNKDGTPLTMSARRGPGGLVVHGTRVPQPYTAPPNAIGSTYWNMRTVSVPLIDTEDGHLMDEHVAAGGETRVPLGSGQSVQANLYTLSGDAKVELWYEASSALASMRYYAKDGSTVTYMRL